METSNSVSTSQTEPYYYTECGPPIYVQSHMLQTMSTKVHKIPEKSNLMLKFPIRLLYKDLDQKILLKVDTGSDINCISLGTFQRLFLNQQFDRSMLILENYSNSPVSIIGKFKAFIQWKGKVFHQEFHVTNVNSSPNLLSRGVSFRMEVLQTCFTVTGKELPQLSQMKQGKHSIDSNVRKSPLTMHKHSTDSSVRKSTLNMHSINPESVSKSPLTKEKILGSI